MTDDERQAVRRFVARKDSIFSVPCGCLGPINGEPLCPCAMKYVEEVNGVYYRVTSVLNEDGMSEHYIAKPL